MSFQHELYHEMGFDYEIKKPGKGEIIWLLRRIKCYLLDIEEEQKGMTFTPGQGIPPSIHVVYNTIVSIQTIT